MARVFTREQFYELVWSKPMTHLAKEFAISDVALHKICKKHGIPNPPLGWWAKKAAGKKVKQTPLPKAKMGTADKITIVGADLSFESSILVTVREQARILASENRDDRVVQPHPIIERSLARLGKAKPSDIGVVVSDGTGIIKCEVAVQSIDRLSIILPRIVEAALLQGFKLVTGEGRACFKSETESIDFSISEIIRREAHVQTDAERIKEEAWQRKRDREAQYGSWIFDRPRFPEWDYRPTGQLSFQFEQRYFLGGLAPRRSFRDAKIQRLENMASEIAVGLAVFAAAKTEDCLKRDAEQRRVEEERQRRELAARIKHIEDRRITGLSAILTELDELDRLRRLIVMLTTNVSAQSPPRLSTFLTWAKEYLEKREADFSPHVFEERLTREHLFGDDDDRDFKSSRWR